MTAGHSVGPGRWAAETDRLLDRMAGRFPRVETRREADPHGMQYLLARVAVYLTYAAPTPPPAGTR